MTDEGAEAGADPGKAAGLARARRGMVLWKHTAKERRRLAREARRALEVMKAERGMAEKKAECTREEELAKEPADRHTPEVRARDEEEADTLQERLRRETPFTAHHARKVTSTDGVPFFHVMPVLSAVRPQLLDDDHLLIFVVDTDEYGQPTYYSFANVLQDIKQRLMVAAHGALVRVPVWGGPGLPRDRHVQGRARRAVREAACTFRDEPALDSEDSGERKAPRGEARVKRWCSHWQLTRRRANLEGYQRFLRSFETRSRGTRWSAPRSRWRRPSGSGWTAAGTD